MARTHALHRPDSVLLLPGKLLRLQGLVPGPLGLMLVPLLH